jgi:thioredoxin reductase (NADPH)
MLAHDELLKIPLFESLEPKGLDYLASVVPDIHLAAGNYVVHEGENRALIIVIEGKPEILKVVDGVERVIGYRTPGRLFGEVTIVLNTPFLASARAVDTSRVTRIEPKVFHTVAATAPQISATLGAAAVERIGGLQNLANNPKRTDLWVMGPRWQPEVQALRSFLHRNQIDFEWLPPDSPNLAAMAPLPNAEFPRVRLPNGDVLVAPSIQALATAVGLSSAPSRDAYDVVIIGGGPAGMALGKGDRGTNILEIRTPECSLLQ